VACDQHGSWARIGDGFLDFCVLIVV
jgi:hypothetical protein